MEWSFDDGRPIYTQLVEQMEQAIATGAYHPGDKLPGVRELAAEAGVNPNTMQRALAELEAKGLVFTQRTSGRFVTQNQQLIAASRRQMADGMTHSYVRGMQALGFTDADIQQIVKDAL